MRSLIVASVLIAVASLHFACTSGTGGTGGGSGGTGGAGGSGGGAATPPACGDAGPPTITVSGALTGTPQLPRDAVFTWSRVDGTTNYSNGSGSGGGNGSGGPILVSMGFAFLGQPDAGFTLTESSGAGLVFGSVWISQDDAGTAGWRAVRTPPDSGLDPPQGTFTLHLDRVCPPIPGVPDLLRYEVHGTMNATLPPVQGGGATGVVNVTMTF